MSLICEMLKCADWIVDIGPEAGLKGGEIVFTGTPDDLLICKGSYTVKYLRQNKRVGNNLLC